MYPNLLYFVITWSVHSILPTALLLDCQAVSYALPQHVILQRVCSDLVPYEPLRILVGQIIRDRMAASCDRCRLHFPQSLWITLHCSCPEGYTQYFCCSTLCLWDLFIVLGSRDMLLFIDVLYSNMWKYHTSLTCLRVGTFGLPDGLLWLKQHRFL